MVDAYPVEAEVGPAAEDGGVYYAGLAGFLELVGHVGSVPLELAPDEGVAVGVYWVAVWCDVEACSVAAHVVVVLVGLGGPVVEHELGHVPAFDDVGGEGVPVVVVARVLVVEERCAAALVLGAEPPVVPVGDHMLAVWVEARHHYADDVVPDASGFLVFPGYEVVRQLGGHLGAPDLGGVEAHGLDDHGLPFIDEGLDVLIVEVVWVCDLFVDFLDAFQVLYVLLAGDEDG